LEITFGRPQLKNTFKRAVPNSKKKLTSTQKGSGGMGFFTEIMMCQLSRLSPLHVI
jgi:hypothetical protein